jgi:thioesterase domain-containing protein
MIVVASDRDGEPLKEGAYSLATFDRSGVRAERLRAGSQETLFIVPGPDGDLAELAALVSAFTGPQEVYALISSLTDDDGRPVTSIERMAELMVPVVRELSPTGSCYLAGYSFGALIMLEVSHRLREAGQPADALFLIDGVCDERFWPRRIWLQALTRRTGRHLIRIAHMHPTRALAELRMRAERLTHRVIRRGSDTYDPFAAAADNTAMFNRALTAMAGYRPRFYDGPLTLIAPSVARDFGCDTADIWSGYVGRLHVQRVNGDHLSILKEPSSAAAVARVIDRGLSIKRADWNGLKPAPGFERPMILTAQRWFSAARLAHALSEAGFVVSACRPRGHPLDQVDSLATARRLHKLWPLRSIAAAIRAADPDLVICDDESSLALLRRLLARVRTTDPEMAELLVRSLGDDWPCIMSRTELASEARALNLATPETAVIDNADALHKWVTEHDLPIVLKTDGSWGGRGVAIVHDEGMLPVVWRWISSPPGLLRALKRAVFDRDLDTLVAWRRRERPIVNVQQFCAGREAIVTTASVDGKMQGLVCLEVIQRCEPRGSAAVVRIIDHPQMAATARQLIRRFGLTGFCGFDFMVDDSGNAQLLETNPRITPTCHLLVEGDCRPDRIVGVFPFELLRNRDPGADVFGILDMPIRAPLLIEHGTKLAARYHRPGRRAIRRVTQMASEKFYRRQ